MTAARVGSKGSEVRSTGDGVGSTGAGVNSDPSIGAHPQSSSINAGRNPHWSKGIAPPFPTDCSIPHDTDGCPGNEKITSGEVTSLPSPQTEQPIASSAGVDTGAGETGVIESGTDPVPSIGAHSQTAISAGRDAHWLEEIIPFCPTVCRMLHNTDGCPGNSKMASCAVTSLPLPQMEQP